MKDFFISYTSVDRNWAEWIAWQLEEAGYSVDIQVWDFRPSHDFIAEMDRASREAERTLAVLTPEYFDSRFTQAEWTAAFAKGNLLPVRVADFDVKGLLSVRVYIDLVGKGDGKAKEALLTGVKLERRKPATAPSFARPSAPERSVTERPRFPGALPPIWNVPHQLAEALGDLPLALEQGAAYIEATGESLADYRKMFQTSWQELLLEGKPDDYPDTVAVTGKISFDKAQEESPAAGELLNLCAFLAPDDIPLAILRDGVKHLPSVLAEAVADKLAFNKAIAALRHYSLMGRNDDSVSFHRLVQMVARDWLPEG